MEEDIIENLNLDEIAEAMLEDEMANDGNPDEIDTENLEVEGTVEE